MSLEENPPSKSRRLPVVLIGIGLLAILALTVGVAIWGGYQSGLKQHQLEAQATRSAELKTQFDLGVADLSAGNNELAQQRFEYILSIDPSYPGAADKLEEAKVVLQITPSATLLPIPTMDATVTPVATGAGPDPASILAQAQQSSAGKNWDDVIQKLSDLRALDANYKPAEVNKLLFTALRNRGVARIDGKELESGIFDLNQAETLAPLDTDAKSHRLWARYYLDAMSYWGLDWKRTVDLLSELHTFAPYFQDTPARLYQAHLNYAAQLAAAKNYCDAAAQYAAAQALSPAPAVAEKQAAAQAQCVPTPVGETGTPGTTPTPAR
jgi:tetratricopeptide (TPR) repeat protein